jgi:hypothetical protein
MNWLLRYRIRLYMNNSIWLFPVLSIGAAFLLVRLLTHYESTFGWRLDMSPENARVLMITIGDTTGRGLAGLFLCLNLSSIFRC